MIVDLALQTIIQGSPVPLTVFSLNKGLLFPAQYHSLQ